MKKVFILVKTIPSIICLRYGQPRCRDKNSPLAGLSCIRAAAYRQYTKYIIHSGLHKCVIVCAYDRYPYLPILTCARVSVCGDVGRRDRLVGVLRGWLQAWVCM